MVVNVHWKVGNDQTVNAIALHLAKSLNTELHHGVKQPINIKGI